MPSDSGNNGFNSDTTSTTSPMRMGYDEKHEAVFLRQQAEDAKIAVQQTLAEMQQTVKTAADIRALTQQYPWIAIGATVAAGFMTTKLVLSSAQSHSEPTAAPPSKKMSSISSLMTSSLMSVVRSAVVSTIASLIHANAQDDSDEDYPMPNARADRGAHEGRRVPIS